VAGGRARGGPGGGGGAVNGYPVLMYHALSDGPGPVDYVLPEARFRAQMEAIRGLGLRGVSLAAFVEGGSRDDRAVVLTFDDGSASDRARALPLLREFGFSATFFVTTGRVGTDPEAMGWDDVAALAAAGMDVQVHGHTHRLLSDLGPEAQLAELEEPAALLERHLGRRPWSLSFPGGRYTPFAVDAARRLGYHALCTSEPGLNPHAAADGALVRRFLVHQGTSDAAFACMIGRDPRFAARALSAYRVKRAAQRLLGNRAYQAVWERFRKRGAA